MRLAMPMYETEVLRYRENKKRGQKSLLVPLYHRLPKMSSGGIICGI